MISFVAVGIAVPCSATNRSNPGMTTSSSLGFAIHRSGSIGLGSHRMSRSLTMSIGCAQVQMPRSAASRCAIFARRRRRGLDHVSLTSPPPPLLQIDVVDARLDRAPIWRLESHHDAVRLHLPQQSRKRRSRWLEVEARDRLLDDLLASLVERAIALGSSPRSVHQRCHCTASPE